MPKKNYKRNHTGRIRDAYYVLRKVFKKELEGIDRTMFMNIIHAEGHRVMEELLDKGIVKLPYLGTLAIVLRKNMPKYNVDWVRTQEYWSSGCGERLTINDFRPYVYKILFNGIWGAPKMTYKSHHVLRRALADRINSGYEPPTYEGMIYDFNK